MILLKTETEASRPGVQVAMIGREGMVGGLALLGGDSLAFASAVTQIPGIALRIPVVELRRCFDDSPVLREACLRFVQSLTRQIMSSAASNASLVFPLPPAPVKVWVFDVLALQPESLKFAVTERPLRAVTPTGWMGGK